MAKPVIEEVELGHPLKQQIDAIKEAIEVIHGERQTRITQLDATTATTEDVANKINELLTLLQG